MYKTVAVILMLVGLGVSVAEVAELEWLTDFEEAKTLAAEKGLPILADFTGSDWCGFCIRLKDEVFETEPFGSYAAENLVLLQLDFPMRKKLPEALQAQNEELRVHFGVRGFPTIVLMDAEGEELARTGYRRGGPGPYIEHLKELLAAE